MALEKRMAAWRSGSPPPPAGWRNLSREQRAGFEALKKEVPAPKENQERAVRKVEEALPETHLSLRDRLHVVGRTPGPAGPPACLYTLAGTLTYYPAQRVGYELLTGRTPGELLVGLGALYGTGEAGREPAGDSSA